MLAKVLSGALLGIDAYPVEVEVDIAQGLPQFATVGLPEGAVKESKDRVKSAIKNSGYEFPTRRITISTVGFSEVHELSQAGRVLVLVIILLLEVAATNLAQPLFAGKLTEALLDESGSMEFTAGYILIAWLILLILRAALSMGSSYLVGTTGALMSAELRSRVYEHMQILPLAWFQQRKQGDVLSLLSSDAESISRFVTNTVVHLLPQLLTLTFAFLVLLTLDPVIAGIAALLLPAYTITTKLLGRRIRPVSATWISSLARSHWMTVRTCASSRPSPTTPRWPCRTPRSARPWSPRIAGCATWRRVDSSSIADRTHSNILGQSSGKARKI